TVSSSGLIDAGGNRVALSSADQQVLLSLPRGNLPVDRSLSNGDYRLVAVETPYGDVIVTGLPLADKQSTEASLVWTMVLVS
ncbi:hypothetical protein, partial [Chryseobacterium sp. SIMBA_028]